MPIQDLINSIESCHWKRDDKLSNNAKHVYTRSDKPVPIVIRGNLTDMIPTAEALGIISDAC